MWDTETQSAFSSFGPQSSAPYRSNPQLSRSDRSDDAAQSRLFARACRRSRALARSEDFFAEKKLGISGVAAATFLQEGDETALEMVRQLMDDPDAKCSAPGVSRAGDVGKEESVVRELQNAYAGADHEKKLHILEALGKDRQCRDVLVFSSSGSMSHSPFSAIAAAAALIQSVNR